MNDITKKLQEKYDDYIELLSRLVNVDCGSKNIEGVNKVASILHSVFSDLGSNYEINIVEQKNCGNHLCITRKGSVPGKIMLIGHMDTVFPVGTVAYTIGAWHHDIKLFLVDISMVTAIIFVGR